MKPITSTGEKPSLGAISHIGDIQEVSSSNPSSGLPQQAIGAGEFLMNEKGQYVINIQTATWITKLKEKELGTPNLQYRKVYPGEEHSLKDEYPSFLDYEWHPQPTLLNLRYSHSGYWVLAPKARGDKTGPFYLNHNIARIEPYIDLQGNVKEAVAYGRDMNMKIMQIWFDLDKVKAARGSWIFPEIPYFYNSRKWKNKLRREHEKLEAEQPKEKEDPRQGHNQRPRGLDYNSARNRGSNSQRPRYYSDWEDERNDIPQSEPGRSPGVGRASRITRLNRSEKESNPGQRYKDRKYSDRSQSRDRANYDDRSQSRDRARGNGTTRARKNHYGGRS